jgi:hypothetical protein
MSDSPTTPIPAWRVALNVAIVTDPRGRAGVAEKLGCSRPYVSRVTTGDIDPAPAKFVRRVIATLMRVECPHLGVTLAPDECRTFAARTYARISATEVPHWRACQKCPVKAPPRDGFAASPRGGDTSGPAEPDPRCPPDQQPAKPRKPRKPNGGAITTPRNEATEGAAA